MPNSPPVDLKPDQNHLLEALPSVVRSRLEPHMRSIKLSLGDVLYESGSAMHQVIFPVDAIVSMLYVMENGSSAEISVVGNEGLVGISLFMGGESTSSSAVVHSAGWGYQVPAKIIKDEFHRHSQMMILFLRYTQSLITQMSQTAVCNRHHNISQQLCRLLLLSLDRLNGDTLVMTQELLGHMLGVRREGITEAAGKLQAQGVISYRRGAITVLDRAKLEQLSCECYRVVKTESDRLLHYLPN